MGALLDGDQHDITHTHDTTEQREEPNHPEGCADDTYTRLHLQVVGIAVPQPDGTLILWMRLVVGIDALTIALLKIFVGLLRRQTVEGKLDAPCIIRVRTIDALDGRIGGEGISAPVLVLLIDAHHLEGKTTHVDILADELRQFLLLVCPGTEQFLRLFITQDDYLAALLDIDVVDESPQHHLHLVYLVMVGIDATDRRGDILLSQTDGGTRTILCSHLIDILLKLIVRRLDVTRL